MLIAGRASTADGIVATLIETSTEASTRQIRDRVRFMKSLHAIWKTADELRLSTQQQCSRHKNVKGPAELSPAGPFM
jgi:hypothetical protein